MNTPLPTDDDVGYVTGDRCNRRHCQGVIEERRIEDCSCHIAPPCSACTEPRGYCNTCGWDARDDRPFNDHIVNVDKASGTWRTWSLRPLDPTKIDYHNKPHTHFSQILEGVYPEGTTREEVEAEVKGTFGGRFDYFGNGRFKYVAYTD